MERVILRDQCGGSAQLGSASLFLYVSLSHTIRHKHTHTHIYSVRHISTSDKHVAEATTYTTRNKQDKRSSTPSAGFEPAIPIMILLQTYALGSTAAGIGWLKIWTENKCFVSLFVRLLTSVEVFMLSGDQNTKVLERKAVWRSIVICIHCW